jgi:hypothetical protein
VKSNLISSNEPQTKDKSHTYEISVTISNFKQKEIKIQLEFHETSGIIFHETTCTSGKLDGNTFILPIKLKQSEIYQCQFNITLKQT